MPPDDKPTQHELDSLETVSPPRSRKALVAVLIMTLAVVCIISGVTIVFVRTFLLAESIARTKADANFADERYGAAAADYEALLKTFPNSEHHKRYEFMRDLAKIGEDASSPLQPTPKEPLERLRQFLDLHKDDPLLKENRKAVGLILVKMADIQLILQIRMATWTQLRRAMKRSN